MSDFKKDLDKKKKKGRSRVVKRLFGLTFDKVRDDKDSTKKKALFLRKKERAIIIHQKCIIYKRPACKNLKACYYASPKIALKEGAPSARTQEIANQNLKKKYIKKKLTEIKNKRMRIAQGLKKSNQD